MRPLAEAVGSDFVEPCDVSQDGDIRAIAEKARARFGGLDILVHSIAFANREDLTGPYYNVSRANFALAMDVSVYSFTALAREFQPLMNPGGALLTLTYLGSVRAIQNYNVMGVAKAALEASVRYLAMDLGADEKHLRVNAISAGPIRTLSVAGIAGSRQMISEFGRNSLLRRTISIDDVGNAAVYLCSDLAGGVTGEIHYVDAGFSQVGFSHLEDGPKGS